MDPGSKPTVDPSTQIRCGGSWAAGHPVGVTVDFKCLCRPSLQNNVVGFRVFRILYQSTLA